MKKFILATLFFSFHAHASILQICNTHEDVSIYSSMLRQVGAGAGWQSRGWFKVEAKKCLSFDMGAYLGKIYLYAEDEKKEASWGDGPIQYCVHSQNAFSYNNGDTMPCTDPGQKRVRSYELEMRDGTNTWTISPSLTKLDLCNENSFAVFAAIGKDVGANLAAKGWFRVEPNSCRPYTVGQYTGKVYTYAEFNTGDLTWGSGPKQFCVNRTDAFDFPNAQLASECDPLSMKMVNATATDVTTGITKITFEPKTPKTVLRLCNTTARAIASSYAIATQATPLVLKSSGWVALAAKQCDDVDLGGYVGEAHVYAEFDKGAEFWGSGPTNFCVHRTTDFTFDDATNVAQCNSSIQQKMVPTFKFDVVNGTNIFSFN